ncbi:winged helix-turn-helix domain-containing protein [Caballeronia sp. LZ003]|uniref:winged helix-turn-helix domain-containing protein n=1 Tax=unclassified Caballeronia TaxID=2646786 RepID=UPI003857B780
MPALSRLKLTSLLHGTHSDFAERQIDLHVWRLRQAIEEDPGTPRLIQTIREAGYMFVPG